jgi:MSHA biogenesis protein MshN
MSVINKMLQDLDRRQALGAAPETAVVRPQAATTGNREWFWRVLVVLLTAALAWMGWVAIQLLPRKPVATEFAFQAAAEAKSRAAAKPAAVAPAPTPPAPPAEPVAAQPAPAPEVVLPAPSVTVPPAQDSLRLATTLETPVQETPPAPAKVEAPTKPVAVKPKPAAAPPVAKASVDKRDRKSSASDNAEAHFRRAALLLSQGRVSEAEERLQAALQADPSHVAARQTYVSLLLEHQRVDSARHLLQEGLAINPAQATFGFGLARIYVEQRDYPAALEVMDRVGLAARNPEFQALRGAVLQRLGRHSEALEAYDNAIRGGKPPATTWIGLGISLEAVGRRSDAAQAYRRALSAGPVAAEAREYAESRARALQ